MSKESLLNECFVIMPMEDTIGYKKSQFQNIYDNIISPACISANLKAIRANDIKKTNLIQINSLQKLIDAPIAICDLSNTSPNVLFELGVRQALDKPVILLQEKDTKKIFDTTSLQYLEYTKDMKDNNFSQIKNDLKNTLERIIKIQGNTSNINAMINLLKSSHLDINSKLKKTKKEKNSLEVLHSKTSDMRKAFETMMLKAV